MKYLDFHNKCIEKGHMPGYGLCSQFKYDPLFKLIDPEKGNYRTYWAHGFEEDDFTDMHYYWVSENYAYTPLRQTVVLLMAAMAGEL